MTPADLFKQGKLQEAIQAQTAEVRAAPGDQGKRVFLFELLVFAGDLDRARKQIEATQYNEMELDAGVANYRRLLGAEEARRKLFEDGVAPFFFGAKPHHVDLRLQAIQALRDNRPDEAARLLREANEIAPKLKGTLNGKPFDGLRDCDDLFGPVLEFMGKDRYVWVPLEEVETIALNPPRFPRDLIWLPARMELRNQGMGEVFLPVLYPGTHKEGKDLLKLGRETDFSQKEPVLGKGARLFFDGEDVVPLTEWREVTFDELPAPVAEGA